MRIDLNTARGLAFVPGVMHGKEYASLVIVIGVNAMQANNDLIYIYIYMYMYMYIYVQLSPQVADNPSEIRCVHIYAAVRNVSQQWQLCVVPKSHCMVYRALQEHVD
jgi:hypothetical protein